MDLFKTVQDSITPEEDPASQEKLDAKSKETLQHIATNSSRAFFWKELAQYSLTTMAIFGGMAIGGAAVLSAGTALAIAGGAGMIGLLSSVVAHRIELKNEISLEELYAKRTGQSVAESLAQLKSAGKERMQAQQKTTALPETLPPMPYQTNLHASRRFQAHEEVEDAPTLPSTRISAEQVMGETISVPAEKTIH